MFHYTKEQQIEQVCGSTVKIHLTKAAAEDVYDVILGTDQNHSLIMEGVLTHGRIQTPLGVFEIKVAPARTGRNPVTGESIQIPQKRKLVFKPSLQVKRILNP